METEEMNRLYFGDCLDVLKELHGERPQGFIDLIYIDPPFNSQRNYNILFEEADLEDVRAQKEAFADTWSNVSYKDTIQEIHELDLDLYNFLQALDSIRVSKSSIAYLTMMAIRIYYMHKVLKNTGSLYLHCDPNMSHYLKILCDLVFGQANFRSEIVWRRTNAHNKTSKQYGPIHDVILFFSKTSKFVFHPGTRPYTKTYIGDRFIHKDERGIYQTNYLTGPGVRYGESGMEWKGFNPTKNGRHWAIPNSLNKFLHPDVSKLKSIERLELLHQQGLIIFPKKEGGQPMYKQYIGKGVPYQDLWAYQPNTNGVLHESNECIDEDVKYLENEEEILGYPTQKPAGLLKRIIVTSTNKGDLVADFFCGCGTTIAACQELGRKWIGVDISHLAIGLIERKRLIEPYGERIKKTYEINGLPKDVASAKNLASEVEKGRLKFQRWIIETMMGGVCNPKKTADGGWDGHLTFDFHGKKETVLIEVKSGNANVKNLREFIQVTNKQKASVGVFVCFKEQVTKPMESAAKDEGYYAKEFFGTTYDRIQILTVEDLLDGKNVNIPVSTKGTFKTAKKASTENMEQSELI